MNGAIAAGHPATAAAGARILAEGGNAIDACLAAAFTSWVAESTLTGPGGGGFLLVHRARDRTTRVLDFYVAIPGRGRSKAFLPEMDSIEIQFSGGSSSQVFHVGPASVAVPGTIAGLEAAHRLYGSLPWRQLIEPAHELARDGVRLTAAQAYLHAILDSILGHTEEGRQMYRPSGTRLLRGELFVLPDLARTLETLAEEGAEPFYRGRLAADLVEHLRAGRGGLTRRDLTEYRVIWRRPVRVDFSGYEVASNPPPSSGGLLIAYGLRLLERLGPHGGAGSAKAMAVLVEVMREQARQRGGSFAADLYRGGLAGRLLADETITAALARLDGGSETRAEPAGSPNTTHISVLDRRGNAASLTASTGSGSGVIVPGTGIHLNNMLGEYDLTPAGGTKAGRRLTSMMAPTLALLDGRPRLVAGSAGSVRLRGAILQVVVNVLRHGLGVEEALDRPRLHADDEHVHCEGGNDATELDRLEALGYDVVRWRRRNLFFGGAAAVEVDDDGRLAAAGDPRRSGHGIVVE